jgi:uncharacterized protein involved in response to NO
MSQEKLHATNHYLYYPDEENIPSYLAYGFRPIFLLLAPYMILSMLLWILVFSGVIPFFSDDILTWHIYEMSFGILTAGTLAFLTTGLPELFPGMVPFVGKRLKYIVILWLAGRISFWFIDFIGVYIVAFFNLAMLGWIIYFAKDAVLDKLQRHASLGYALVLLFGLETWFFAIQASLVDGDAMAVLKMSIGALVILIILALRRINMEAINELLEDKGIDAVYLSRPPLSNFAIFMVALYSLAEFLYPHNSTTAWLALAAAASLLAITSDYNLKDRFILNQPYVLYLGSIYILLALGYAFVGWDILSTQGTHTNHLRHLITTGGMGMSYLMVMIIISWIHTGRHLRSNLLTHAMVLSIILATLLRVMIVWYESEAMLFYSLSALFWCLAFGLYMLQFYRFLLTPRADGVKG